MRGLYAWIGVGLNSFEMNGQTSSRASLTGKRAEERALIKETHHQSHSILPLLFVCYVFGRSFASEMKNHSS